MAANKHRDQYTIADLRDLADHNQADAFATTVRTTKGKLVETVIIARSDAAKKVLKAIAPRASNQKKGK